MDAFRSLNRGVSVIRPFVNALRRVERDSEEGGTIAVLDGDPTATARLRAILGVAEDEPLRDGTGLLVHAAVPGHDPTLAAAVLAGAKREGRQVLAILVGSAPARAELERVFLAAQPLEPSNVAYVRSLDDPTGALSAVALALGDQAVAAGRRHLGLRKAVADLLVARAARQAGAVGMAIAIPAADLPVITLIQVRLVAQLAALHGRPLDVRRGLEIAGVLLNAFAWRALARRAVRRVPVGGFAVRGGVAFSGTVAVGEAAHAYFTQAGDKADQPLEGLQKALKKAAARRGRR